MAFISYNKLWESQIDAIVSKRDKVQNFDTNQMNLEVHDTLKKDETITTNLEPTDNADVINKAYLDEKMIKINGHISLLKKEFNEFELEHNKQSVEEIFFSNNCENNYSSKI